MTAGSIKNQNVQQLDLAIASLICPFRDYSIYDSYEGN